MPTATYKLISSITLESSSSSVVFSNIPQSYRDLVLINSGISSGTPSNALVFRPNGDASNSSSIFMYSDGSSAPSGTSSVLIGGRTGSTQSAGVTNFIDYSATDKHKLMLSQGHTPAVYNVLYAGRWASNAAITSISIYHEGSSVFDAGMSFNLYGIGA